MCDDERKFITDGPDPVAVVMAVEEKFNITIPDRDAEKILNMGQLYDVGGEFDRPPESFTRESTFV